MMEYIKKQTFTTEFFLIPLAGFLSFTFAGTIYDCTSYPPDTKPGVGQTEYRCEESGRAMNFLSWSSADYTLWAFFFIGKIIYFIVLWCKSCKSCNFCTPFICWPCTFKRCFYVGSNSEEVNIPPWLRPSADEHKIDEKAPPMEPNQTEVWLKENPTFSAVINPLEI
jgi:hypothetical protein